MTHEEMEITRSNLYNDYLAAIGTPKEKEILRKLDLMDRILDAIEGYEAEEEEEEEEDTTTHWDEWLLDLQIDLEMDRRLMMGYER